MANEQRPSSRHNFEIAIICALPIEFDAIDALLEVNWEEKESYGKAFDDPNAYRAGRIGNHNAIVVLLPEMGEASSITAADFLRISFPNIKLGLVVGICGGVPFNSAGDLEIVLGDVVISTNIIRYTFGRQYPDRVVREDTLESNLPRPPREIRSFLALLSSQRSKKTMQERTCQFLNELCSQEGFENSQYPGKEEDKLYDRTYRHKHQDPVACSVCAECEQDEDPVCKEALDLSCAELGCSDERTITRKRLELPPGADGRTSKPLIHFGWIASGDLVMKSGSHRDRIAREEKVLAFEMEGAGVWEAFPTVVIKGVCDYADSHKDKKWQPHAAASAAACTKAFLREWRIADKPSGSSTAKAGSASSSISDRTGNSYQTTFTGADNRGVQGGHIGTLTFNAGPNS